MNATQTVLELINCLIESSDSDSSDSKDDILLISLINKKCLTIRARCQNYVEDVVPSYTDKQFQMHFR